MKRLACALLLALLPAPLSAQPAAPPPISDARAGAPFDVTGQWVPLITEDWRWRMITPPVGLDLFVASAITKVPLEKVVKASLPYLYALLGSPLILTFFPRIITILPDLLR